MTIIEEQLEKHKQTSHMIKAPSELESRLRSTLEHVAVKKKKRNKAMTWFASSAAALLLIFGTYHYSAFAYYGGMLLNKMELSSLSFSEVEEKGYGQTVNKSTTLDDGTVITIDGVIADDNAFLLYYTIDRPDGSIYTDNGSDRYSAYNIKGFLTDSDWQGGGKTYRNDEDETYFKGVYKFEPVSPFSRTLTVTFIDWPDNEEKVAYPISFKYEANKAMKSIIKEEISKSVTVDQGAVHYDSITASPTSTIVKGHYELDIEGSPRFSGNTKLYVNGIEVKQWEGRSESVTEKGVLVDPVFVLEYDVIPTDKVETIELVLANFPGKQKVEEPISLASPSDQSIKLGSEKIWIRSVTKTDTGYDVVIARKQFTFLKTDNLSVQAGGKVIPVSSISDSRPWDLKNGNILWEQTYSFKTSDKPDFLLLDEFDYIEKHNKSISIPINKK
ncbi:DUF4179 domain-containing protein [Paenibacillus gallinarum]|uniref:DUF4179 domain-containing protein n=1 Tax=Paenibacillus gallinarum TaxID=2762232 RepID=A0ABR8T191_9BACL|nr:DUF4179 domain-containing protein [Paenibacillus gallinarum]MBD7969521.1 DUF4179 domain-containing protein [Paenibacillus gallinarum]